MNDSDSRVGLVDMLTACAAGAVCGDLKVLVAELDLFCLCKFGHYFDRSKGGLASSCGVKGGYADETVNAVLALQVSVSVCALDGDGGALDARLVSVKPVYELNLEFIFLTPACDHSVEHHCPVLSLGAACAGVEGNDSVV